MINESCTRERQYQPLLELQKEMGLSRFGLMSNYVWFDDPKRIVFLLARYKFVAKMLSGKQSVLEVGCGDAFGTPIVAQETGSVTAIDFDPIFVRDAQERMNGKWKFVCKQHDMLSGPVEGPFEAAYSLDVLEHILPQDEERFISNIARSLTQHGVFIAGTPSLQSQAYASPQSKEGHVNCKDHKQLKSLLLRHFHHVFLFSMNDEVVHTGFYPMAHYLFGVCADPKKS